MPREEWKLSKFQIPTNFVAIRGADIDAVYHRQWIFDTPTTPDMHDTGDRKSEKCLVQVWRYLREKDDSKILGFIPIPKAYAQHWFQLFYTIAVEQWAVKKFDRWYSDMRQDNPGRDRAYSAVLMVSLELTSHLEARIRIIQELLALPEGSDNLPIFDEHLIRERYDVSSVPWEAVDDDTMRYMIKRPLDPINAPYLGWEDRPSWTIAPPFESQGRYYWQFGHVTGETHREAAIIRAIAGAWSWLVEDPDSDWKHIREGQWEGWSDVRGEPIWLEDTWISRLPTLEELGMTLPESRLWKGRDISYPNWRGDNRKLAAEADKAWAPITDEDEDKTSADWRDFFHSPFCADPRYGPKYCNRCTLRFESQKWIGEVPMCRDFRDYPHAPSCRDPSGGPRGCDRCCLRYLTGHWQGEFPSPPSPIREIQRAHFPRKTSPEVEMKPTMRRVHDVVGHLDSGESAIEDETDEEIEANFIGRGKRNDDGDEKEEHNDGDGEVHNGSEGKRGYNGSEGEENKSDDGEGEHNDSEGEEGHYDGDGEEEHYDSDDEERRGRKRRRC
ncbi:hypothetical protein CONPUDRAFT_68710 [Coniophora puteana RWD-64-598 SS2]|uniref:Uncharacterized protein n=1 Tax=Coniophora puteana (strain RWD-64-598) TaxID=741705 RepID=A0A5M3N5H1_CONPW|nr:uncharacterized protein CONPUDRAFT_68710 [Coniophora puteana RWD-64-598 SS2]EIW86105.1 hypothetical protein CONPUDRAFT_68710 [Coniophora puteana RWD-64-598 SS2]